jgi:hypothetical protein
MQRCEKYLRDINTASGRIFLLSLAALASLTTTIMAETLCFPSPARFDTGLHADAVEFCPVEGLHNVLVCGTYQLQESEQGGRAEHQTRLGRLYLLRVGETGTGGEEQGGQPQLTLHEESRLDVPGVFDIKWSGSPHTQTSILGHAAADGFLYAYALSQSPGVSLSKLGSIDCRKQDSTRECCC